MFTDKDVPGILYFISLIKKYNIVYSKNNGKRGLQKADNLAATAKDFYVS